MTQYSTRKAMKRRASKRMAAKARNLRRMRAGRSDSTTKALIGVVASAALMTADLALLLALVIGRPS